MTYSWDDFLKNELNTKEMKLVLKQIELERANNDTIYPSSEDVFNAFTYTSFESISVVILGQDPYPTKGFAHGLSFSVNTAKGRTPPSLKNIYDEINRSFQVDLPVNRKLECWATQGVFLLNSALTINLNKKEHHLRLWKNFTNKVIKYINDNKESVVFLSWGKKAHEFTDKVDQKKHKVIKTSHPTTMSCKRSGVGYIAFSGSNCFYDTNEYLISKNKAPIDWNKI
ncbi:uracil-DNA glycosylase [Parashewanella curva]|uniref:Uracil-DNA glycosylase n=1 Tax=Parashewanella curva TaxID=2338552 RepID=A0A3L8PXV7_9GAMM|nr:uracil-DNA glycosylase [Parashewanella curva]RLV60171.1 uracil-DNA glycosylase [Parashewanella curva]